MSAYIGEKVIILERIEHTYVHIVEVDGETYQIDENGFLGIKEGFKLGKYDPSAGFEHVPILFRPAGWNFVYDNKNPGLEPAVYKGSDPRLPPIYPNCAGKSDKQGE